MAKAPRTEAQAEAQGDQGKASATDKVDAEVIKAPQAEAQAEAQGDQGKGAPAQAQEAPIMQITDPAHAMAVLKGKVGVLHKIVHDVGHFSTLAFNDAEAVVADISKLVNFIRSHA